MNETAEGAGNAAATGDPAEGFMALALDQARQAVIAEEVPIGALLVEAASREVLAAAHNLVIAESDPTAHAEMLVLRAAAKALGAPRLVGCDLYVTLEPCPMCAQAISFARIRRLIFGAADPKGGGVLHGPRIFTQPTCHHRPQVKSGILAQDCGQLLKDFFRARRRGAGS